LKPHAEFVEDQHCCIERGIAELKQETQPSGPSASSPTTLNQSIEQYLLEEFLQHACYLEAQARRMILNQLITGSQPVIVLQADQNQMLRDMRSLGLSEQALKRITDANEAGNADLLKQVSSLIGENPGGSFLIRSHVLYQTVAYRKTFAQILATGSRLRALQGKDEGKSVQLPHFRPDQFETLCETRSTAAFERRRDSEAEK
jgi:hypothetical protein